MIDVIISYRNMIKDSSIFIYILFGILIGIFVFTMPLLYIVVFICGTGVIVCSVLKPEFVILAIVVLISSIVPENSLPLIPIGIGSIHISDILLFVLFLVVVIKQYINSQNIVITSPLGKPLVLFLFSATVSASVSIIYFGIDLNTVFRIFRLISYYLIFFIITNIITTKKQIRFLVTGLLSVATIVALAMLIQVIVGESIELLPGRIDQAGGLDVEFDALRIRPPGQTLIFISFMSAICFAIYRKGKYLLFSHYLYMVMVLGIGVMLTYNRSYFVAIILSTGLFMFLARAEDRKRLMVLLAGGAAFILLLLMVSSGGGVKRENTFNAISERYLTLFAGKDLVQSGPVTDRYLENSYAIEQIVKHPFLGIGLGNDYRPPIYGSEDAIAYYVHNVYLWLMMDMGIPGFAFFMWFYVGFLIRAMKYFKNPKDDFLKSVATGSMLAGMGMLPMALVIPLFMEWHSIVVIVIFIGLSETIIIYPKIHLED